jgi:hypothetical protein
MPDSKYPGPLTVDLLLIMVCDPSPYAGGFGGLHRTPLLTFFIHMNFMQTTFVEKNPPLPYGPVTSAE